MAYRSNTAVREKLVLQVGKPVTIALEFSTGKLVASNIPGAPDQVYYTLTDGRSWYADLAAAELIDKLDLVTREPFTVTKLGAGRFQVERAGEFPTPPIATQPMPSRMEPQRAAARIGGTRAAETSERSVGGSTPANSHPESTSATPRMNGAGQTAAQILTACYAEAIGIALAASELARSKGLLITPSFEDLRCDAAKLFIEQTGGRR